MKVLHLVLRELPDGSVTGVWLPEPKPSSALSSSTPPADAMPSQSVISGTQSTSCSKSAQPDPMSNDGAQPCCLASQIPEECAAMVLGVAAGSDVVSCDSSSHTDPEPVTSTPPMTATLPVPSTPPVTRQPVTSVFHEVSTTWQFEWWEYKSKETKYKDMRPEDSSILEDAFQRGELRAIITWDFGPQRFPPSREGLQYPARGRTFQ